MPPRKKPTLSERLAQEPVRFAMNVGVAVVEPDQPRYVDVDGRFERVVDEGVTLVREGPQQDSLFTRVYDPAIPADKRVIDAVERKLEREPHWATDVRIGIKKIGVNEPVRPFPNYDNASPEAIVSSIEATGADVAGVLKYELEVRRNKEGEPEPRDEVIDALNELDRKLGRAARSAADEKVSL